MTYRISYLGPEGTFSHNLAKQRFPDAELLPQRSIPDVFNDVVANPSHLGLVPISNSSGGIIDDSFEILKAGKHPVDVCEKLAIKVNLALLGRKGEAIKTIYSHLIPFSHCDSWLREHYPDVARKDVESTAQAALLASREEGAAALANRSTAAACGLDILHYPVESDVLNITYFYCIRHVDNDAIIDEDADKSALIVQLEDRAGSLFDFLEPFKHQGINLSGIESRLVKGCPGLYDFYIDIEGSRHDAAVKKTLAEAEKSCKLFRYLGSFSLHDTFDS